MGWFYNQNQMNRIETQLATILREVRKMSAELDNLTAAVGKIDNVSGSVITLLQNLSAQVSALKTDPAALQALADDLNSKAQALADAVTANTPAAP